MSGLTMVQVAALNAMAAALPGVVEVRYRGEDGSENVAVRVGEGGGWMVNPPGFSACVALGHTSGHPSGVCLYCGEEV